MMEAVLEAKPRTTTGKNEARRTRRAGLVPAVVYGAAGQGPVSIAVEPKALLRILRSGTNTLISLKLEGAGDTRVLVKDYQLDPITRNLLHADFYQIAMDRAIQVTVPVVIKGEARGVKQQGGVLEFVRREIDIECLPADIPANVEIDVSELMVNQGVRVRDVAVAAKWQPVSEPELLLVHVIMPRVEEAPVVAEAAAVAAPVVAAEPEVIKKGKKEEMEEKE